MPFFLKLFLFLFSILSRDPMNKKCFYVLEPRWTIVPNLLHFGWNSPTLPTGPHATENKGLVISPQLKSSALQLVTEMSDGGESGVELAVESTVDQLRFVQLFGGKNRGAPKKLSRVVAAAGRQRHVWRWRHRREPGWLMKLGVLEMWLWTELLWPPRRPSACLETMSGVWSRKENPSRRWWAGRGFGWLKEWIFCRN